MGNVSGQNGYGNNFKRTKLVLHMRSVENEELVEQGRVKFNGR